MYKKQKEKKFISKIAFFKFSYVTKSKEIILHTKNFENEIFYMYKKLRIFFLHTKNLFF